MMIVDAWQSASVPHTCTVILARVVVDLCAMTGNPVFYAVDGEVISSIGKGLCILLGISRRDGSKEVEYM